MTKCHKKTHTATIHNTSKARGENRQHRHHHWVTDWNTDTRQGKYRRAFKSCSRLIYIYSYSSHAKTETKNARKHTGTHEIIHFPHPSTFHIRLTHSLLLRKTHTSLFLYTHGDFQLTLHSQTPYSKSWMTNCNSYSLKDSFSSTNLNLIELASALGSHYDIKTRTTIQTHTQFLNTSNTNTDGHKHILEIRRTHRKNTWAVLCYHYSNLLYYG